MTNYLDSYKSIFLDLNLSDFREVFSLIRHEKSLTSSDILKSNLIDYWSRTNHYDNSFYLPILCVRTALDLFLRVKQFPPQSEIIMSAINIPSMIKLVQCHQLTVIPCDIDLQTFQLDLQQLNSLVTSKTVAIVYAHLYGRCVDVSSMVNFAYEKGIYFIEDCAESFAGFCSCLSNDSLKNVDLYCPRNDNRLPTCYMGHPRSHLILFSFGVLKFCTALGGAFAKTFDRQLYEQMSNIYQSDPIQSTEQYLSNVRKYFYLYWLLNVPYVIKPVMSIVRLFRLNHMEFVIDRLRAFSTIPDAEQLFILLRRQPCRALLAFMFYRFQTYDYRILEEQREKALYVVNQLQKNVHIQLIGMKCQLKNFWLFPIIVSKADLFVQILSRHHIDAYRGTTQLNVITKLFPQTNHACPNGEYLIDNVIYLPVHSHVPKQVLDRLIQIVHQTAQQIEQYYLKSKL